MVTIPKSRFILNAVRSLLVALAIVVLPAPASGVYLNTDGLGQALIYPYFTTQTSHGHPQNTYVTVSNHSADAKALRVRFREGRSGREVASFNLFLSAFDVWAGSLGTSTSGFARLVTADTSCVSPPFTSEDGGLPGLTFSDTFYTGSFADSWGAGADRTREGWVEIVEMATINGASAEAVSHNSSGVPANCGAVQGASAVTVAGPTGNLSGTLTIINVVNGLNFTANAEALADLGTRSFYRRADDPYPDLGAVEIDPVSTVVSDGFVYRSIWSRSIDAVTAVLMRDSWQGELNLESGTLSSTDFVFAFPTRPQYVTGAASQSASSNLGPFARSCPFSDRATSGEPVSIRYADREEKIATWPGGALLFCIAAGAMDFTTDPATPAGSLTTRVLGATNRMQREVNVPASLQSGWARVQRIDSDSPLTSAQGSVRTNLLTGASTTGAHVYYGLPVVGFSARTFTNGAVPCGGTTCLGNYGGAYPLKYTRKIVAM